MTPSITRHQVSTPYFIGNPSEISTSVLDPNFELLSFSEKLKSIGLFDKNFNLLFTPSEIPSISERGKSRFSHLMDQDLHCCTAKGEFIITLKQSEYISGFAKTLNEKGIEIQSYLRGGYAAYVTCLSDYFEFLLHEFLASKNLPKDLFSKEIKEFKKLEIAEIAPHDVDLFDRVPMSIPPTALCDYHIEFLTRATKNKENYKKIKNEGFLKLLIPEVSPAFPYPEDYVLFTIGDPREKFQTDRIIGRLHHEYLYVRDDIRLEIVNGSIKKPESAGFFWQMVIDRELKIARTEFWHKKDFRAGLAALQLIQDDHFLIEDNCSLQSIFHYALSAGSVDIFIGAINRAKLHCKNPFGFLISVLIAYTHSANKMNREILPTHLEILHQAILKTGNEIPPLPSLYNLALLLTIYEDKRGSYRAEWDTSGKGLLTLYVDGHRIIFPKNFSIKGTNEKSLISPQFSSWIKTGSCPADIVYEILENNHSLGLLERVLFELALQKQLTPLTESVKDALVDYLIDTDSYHERTTLAHLFHPWFSASSQKMGWIKALLTYSFKHGLRLWNALKTNMDDEVRCAAFEEIIHLIGPNRPNYSYVLLGEESIPKKLRLKLLKALVNSSSLSPELAVKIIDELIQEQSLSIDLESFLIRTIETLPLKEGYVLWKKLELSITLYPKLLQAIDRLISTQKELLQEDEAWFFNSNPSKERIEDLFLNLNGDIEILLKWMEWKISLNRVEDFHEASATFQKHKNEFKNLPVIYIKFIKQFNLEFLAKEWIESFPLSERMDQVLFFFSQYESVDYPLLEIICSLNGLSKQKLVEILYLKKQPIFENRPLFDLLSFLNYDFQLETKKEILYLLAEDPLNDKDLVSLQRWMKTNPTLSLELISYLLEKKNTNAIPLVLNHLISLKSRKSDKDILFAPLWEKALVLSLANPATLHELIPFFKDRKWIKSVYGIAAETKTKEWGDLLIKQGKVKKSDQSSVEDILSRTKLIYTPLLQLKYFLESIYNQKLMREEMIKPYFKGVVSSLLFSIKIEDKQRHHSLDILLRLFKLGMASKLLTISELVIFEGGFNSTPVPIPILDHNGCFFDPLLHLVQNLPLFDHGSSELYDDWNDKRNEIFETWKGASVPEGNLKKIMDSYSLKILPYELMQASLEYAHLYQLITEQYIENKVTKEEFQEEVQELSALAAQKFKSQELISHEDPCLICINDLSFLLKNKNKRVRAYEAFHYMIDQRTNKMASESVFIRDRRSYLISRQITEDVIIANANFLEKNKVIYCEYFACIMLYLNTLTESSVLQNLHIQDPILDALELESIPLIDKIELQRTWSVVLIKSKLLFNPFQIEKIKSYIAIESKQLIETNVEKDLKKRIIALKAAIRSIDEETIVSEIQLITGFAFHHLPKEQLDKLMIYMEKTLSRKMTYTYTEK